MRWQSKRKVDSLNKICFIVQSLQFKYKITSTKGSTLEKIGPTISIATAATCRNRQWILHKSYRKFLRVWKKL